MLRAAILAIAIMLGGDLAANAQAPIALPQGMTQEQFDILVDAIARSVAEKLRAEAVASPTVVLQSQLARSETAPESAAVAG